MTTARVPFGAETEVASSDIEAGDFVVSFLPTPQYRRLRVEKIVTETRSGCIIFGRTVIKAHGRAIVRRHP
jgi:hypothetical protein